MQKRRGGADNIDIANVPHHRQLLKDHDKKKSTFRCNPFLRNHFGVREGTLLLVLGCLLLFHSRYRLIGSIGEKSNPPGTCINHPSEQPESWKPSKTTLQFTDSGEPWTQEEQKLANEAARKGLEELVDFFNKISKKRIKNLSTNAANSLMDECFGSADNPEFHKIACEATARVVNIVAEDYVGRSICQTCHESHYKAKLLGYANYLTRILPGDSEIRQTRDALIPCMQASFDACGSLSNYLERKDWKSDLKTLDTPRHRIRHFVHRSNQLTDLYNVPGLQVPPDLDQFTAALWHYLAKYKIHYLKGGHHDSETVHHAYMATHAAYMPTGYGRHMQYVEDAPWLYKYIRENFYETMELEDPDLVAEFVDIVRQYGCTEDNDLMVRHGTRYLLDLYVKNGHKWMEEEPSSGDDGSNDYDVIHGPWTAISGVSRRQMEAIVPGSYGYAFRKALERVAETETH